MDPQFHVFVAGALKLQEFAGEDHGSAEPFVEQKGMAWLFSAAK